MGSPLPFFTTSISIIMSESLSLYKATKDQNNIMGGQSIFKKQRINAMGS
jgi:hypothetical protein